MEVIREDFLAKPPRTQRVDENEIRFTRPINGLAEKPFPLSVLGVLARGKPLGKFSRKATKDAKKRMDKNEKEDL